jgi:hypothetical protein
MEVRSKRWTVPLGVVIAGALFVGFALIHAHRLNVDPTKYDQDAYIEYAISQADSGFAALGSRIQMPLFPTFLALFYRHGEPASLFFDRAKVVNIVIAAVASLGLFLLLPRLLPRREAQNLTLVTVFFVLAFRAPYVQVEVISYAAIFVLFLLLCRLWSRPSVTVALLAGAAAAFAFLAKGTGLLGVYVFLAALVLREAVRATKLGDVRGAALRMGTGALVPAVFVSLIWPYARNSKALYGSYLFNMSTRYVMWCDSWEDFGALNVKYGLWTGWRALPQDQLPSMGRYFATHSLGQMVAREISGLAEVIGNCLISHGYAPLFLLVATFAAALAARSPALRARLLRWRDPDWAGWFVLPYLAIHLLMLGFYAPISANNRFPLAMFLPATYALMRAFSGAARTEDRLTIGAASLDWRSFQSLFFALILLQIATYWPAAMVTHYAAG